MSDIKYSVLDHHSFWGWEKTNISPKEADVIFIWNDFTLKEDVLNWQKQDKKVICFEHGWRSQINENSSLFKDIQTHIADYDIILTPKESIFDFIALKMGKKVFRVGKEEDYHLQGEPKTRNILPYTEISTDIFYNNHSIMVNLEDEIVESLKLEKILNWTKTL